jgi:trimethylamine corrinoid protein
LIYEGTNDSFNIHQKGDAMQKEKLLSQMRDAIIQGNKQAAESLAKKAIDFKMDLNTVIENGYISGIQQVGDLWKNGEYFLPELITSGECMKAAMEILRPVLKKADIKTKSHGKVVIGTVEGDIHDIGKNLVSSMLSANGFEVIDLGADVKLEKFISAAQESDAGFICVSSLLTTTMLGQRRLIEMLKENNLYGQFKVMVGGAPVNLEWAQEIGADGYAENAMTAVTAAKNLL